MPAEANALPPSNDPLGDLARARSGSVSGNSGATTTASAAPSANSNAAASSGADPFMYFVQAGAFRTTDDAEAQRAKLSLMGVEAKVTEREQAGRTVYRVRAGPFNKKDDADRLKDRLDGGGMESALVRVQR
ncbi:Cell division protein FtsN [Variovorax paradoxus]|uniref:Cell division protein FtsN n=1 Tax=Variovorax paradoxus TaxID=34073 RepID=A0A679IPH9_VARPD|nr:Cell division protein FtsN [Variovorax paradoxus]